MSNTKRPRHPMDANVPEERKTAVPIAGSVDEYDQATLAGHPFPQPVTFTPGVSWGFRRTGPTSHGSLKHGPLKPR